MCVCVCVCVGVCVCVTQRETDRQTRQSNFSEIEDSENLGSASMNFTW